MPISKLGHRSFAIGIAALAFMSGFAYADGQPEDDPAPLNSEALLVVYPDYPVNTDSWYGNADNVGHAGVLLISSTGLTKYFEFGRYPPQMKGSVRTYGVSNVSIGAAGKATQESLKKVLAEITARSGHNGRIKAAYFVNMDFDKMAASANSPQPTYNLISYNCGHYAEKVATSGNGNVDVPFIFNPTPNNIVSEYIEEGNAELTYDPASNDIDIGDSNENDAKK